MEEKKTSQRLMIALAVVLVGLFGFYYIYENVHANTFHAHTKINGVNVSGKSIKQAETLIEKALNDQTFKIMDGDTVLSEIDVKDLNITYHMKETLKDIKEAQDAMPFHDQAFVSKTYVEPAVSYDEDKLDAILSEATWLSVGDDDKTTNAKLVYNADKGAYDVVDEHYGHNYTKKSVKKDFLNLVVQGKNIMDIATGDYYAKPTLLAGSNAMAHRKQDFEDTVGAVITYQSKGKETVTLDPAIYGDWLTYKDSVVGVSEKKAKSWAKKNLKHFRTFGDTISFKSTKKGTVKLKGSFGVEVSPEKEAKQIVKDILAQKDVTRKPKYTGDPNAGDTYVEVDIRSQMVYCYIDGKQVLKTPCVTGTMNRKRKTDAGAWMIYAKKSPTVLRGPDYESPVTYWMNFNHGEGLHDARWRGRFGGKIYVRNGSHGCVNLPKKAARYMYTHYDIGTPVITFYKD